MIKIGTQDIATIPGVTKVVLGNQVVWRNPEIVPAEYMRLTGIVFDAKVYYEAPFKLEGSDTLRFSFSITKACNVIGCYSTNTSDNNYSLYASGSTVAKYMRYNGGSYSSFVSLDTRYDVEVTPTGITGLQKDSTWEQKDFIADDNMLIGSTAVSASSSKLDGTLYGNVEVVGKGIFVPVERVSDGAIGYYDLISESFLGNMGTGTPEALGYAS